MSGPRKGVTRTSPTPGGRLPRLLWVAALWLACAPPVSAHVFVQPYTLPVPFWMYLYACAATLVLSFAVVAFVMGQPVQEASAQASPAWALRPTSPFARRFSAFALRVGRAGALVCLLLTLAGGFIGTADPRANINLTLFWVGFLLALTYATALLGDVYAVVNPWRTLVEFVERLGVDLSRARLRYPTGLGYWPAFVLYVALIWLELFTLPRPQTLSLAVAIYTAVTFVAVYLFGKSTWFTYGEMFGVFFGLAGLMAPVEYHCEGGRASVRVRAPLTVQRSRTPMHGTLVLFVLFMLSSTTYDAVHQTFLWASLYWQRLLPLAQPLWGGDVIAAQTALTEWYRVYQWAGLVLSPFLYLLVYLVVLGCAKAMTQSQVPLGTLAAEFAPSLVPIALVYHATHYATILIAEFPRLWPLAADPFGLGWQLFRAELAPPRPLDMGFIWHGQVALVLLGHVAGVWLAHRTAVRVFAGARHGVVSQLPMLVLMVAYTCVGLWVLSLPLDVPQLVPIE